MLNFRFNGISTIRIGSIHWQRSIAERDELEEAAKQFESTDNRYIRPIAVIRIDRTGKNQRDNIKEQSLMSATNIQHLGVNPAYIKVKSLGARCSLPGLDLLSPL